MNNGHVLLIEDNSGDADLIRLRLLEGESTFSVSCATLLADGLASMAHKTPSVVLLDLNLPVVSCSHVVSQTDSCDEGLPPLLVQYSD